MSSPPLDELYLRWLYSHVSPLSVKNPARTYWSFVKQLFQKEFIWFVPNDDNRIEDGLALRDEFLDDAELDPDGLWIQLRCSMLEMMIGLSRRLSFMIGGEPRDEFWRLVTHLEVTNCSDRDYEMVPDLQLDIDEILDRVIWRTYNYDGSGGLFPLSEPPKDQRKTEIWLQLNYWVDEFEEGA